jgi:hypothetical protein
VGNLIRYRTMCATVACGAAMMLVGTAAGQAASPPAVTAAATGVTQTSASLNGTINPGGIDTFWEFQWGTSTAYGQNTPPATQPVNGTGSVQVMAPINGLQPGTTYHFRVIAVQGAAGASGQPTIAGGNDISFTTPANGSTPNGSRHSRASLRSRTLVVRHGSTLIPWQCSGTSGAVCKGKISLSARGTIAGKIKTVSCGSGTFIASTGRHHSVRAKLGQKCLSLVENARHHRLGASLKASFSKGAGNLKTPVTLVLR